MQNIRMFYMSSKERGGQPNAVTSPSVEIKANRGKKEKKIDRSN